jgi:hypothetical protein
MNAVVATLFSGIGFMVHEPAAARTSNLEPATEAPPATIAERIERVRAKADKQADVDRLSPRYRLAQWFNFNNFRPMPGPPMGPFPNMGPPGPFPNMGGPTGPFPNMAPWRNF